MPKWLICVPLVAQWIWLSMRYGGLMVPSCANPAITAGGLVGETKMEYFNSMGPIALSATAAHCLFTPAMRQDMTAVAVTIAGAGLSFPMIAKPDLGMCGFGVRLIEDEQALISYFLAFPPAQCVMLQEYLPQEGEAGIFYTRWPGEQVGRITGLALRHFPQVTGDGVSTIAQLLQADRRAQRVQGRTDHDFTIDLCRVPAMRQVVRLATVGSTRVGGLYCDGQSWVTPALTAAIDEIARDMKSFYFGRFDVRFTDLPSLAQGREFRIMEVNGAGSEAIQAWDPSHGLLAALRIIFDKQAELFSIGAANRSRGYKPVGLRRLAQLHFMQQKLLDAYPPSN